jgi:hypothetical protein
VLRPGIVLLLCAAAAPSMAVAADVVPSETGAFLNYCKTNGGACSDKISDISFALTVTSPIDHKMCQPKAIDVAKTVVPKVMEWLTLHPEVAGKATSDGIQMALSQLYPCKR